MTDYASIDNTSREMSLSRMNRINQSIDRSIECSPRCEDNGLISAFSFFNPAYLVTLSVKNSHVENVASTNITALMISNRYSTQQQWEQGRQSKQYIL